MGNFIADRNRLWPNGVVPFEIDNADFPPGGNNRNDVKQAIDHWNNNSVLQLVPHSGQTDYAVFRKHATSCSSFVGRQGGKQFISCNLDGSFDQGSIIHEIGHCIGLFHEHTRSDRDSFVTIRFENIQPASRHNFEKQPGSVDVGPYDYGSIMHYGPRAFALNPNINTIDAPQPIGQRERLSTRDLQSVAEQYQITSLRELKLYWNAQRRDNFTVATIQGEQAAQAAGYSFVRVEGYIFPTQQPGTVPLKLFWSSANNDNFSTATEEGEQAARAGGYCFVRVQGYVYSTLQSGSVPLKLYWNMQNLDNFSTATAEGEQAAQAGGYCFVRNEGYVMPAAVQPPPSPIPSRVKVTDPISPDHMDRPDVYLTRTVQLNVPATYQRIVLSKDPEGTQPIGVDDWVNLTITGPSGGRQKVMLQRNGAYGSPIGEQWILSNIALLESGLNTIKVKLWNQYVPPGPNLGSGPIWIVVLT